MRRRVEGEPGGGPGRRGVGGDRRGERARGERRRRQSSARRAAGTRLDIRLLEVGGEPGLFQARAGARRFGRNSLLVLELLVEALAGALPALPARPALLLALRHAPAAARRLRVADAAAVVGRSRSRLGWTRLGSPRCLRKCGGQGASPRPSSSSRRARSSSSSSEPACSSMSAAGSPRSAQAVGHRVEAQVARLDVGDLVPGQRAGHARVGRRAHRVGGRDRAVARVLVVVDEHAVALLLPPLAGRQLGCAALDLARQRERGAAHGRRSRARARRAR